MYEGAPPGDVRAWLAQLAGDKVERVSESRRFTELRGGLLLGNNEASSSNVVIDKTTCPKPGQIFTCQITEQPAESGCSQILLDSDEGLRLSCN
jgi:hypothetical protein